MDTRDGRRSPRITAHLPVTLTAGRDEEHHLTAEVGLRGVFVVTDAPRPLRQFVTLAITLPDGSLFEVQGMVASSVGEEEAWARGIPSGMGVQFYGLGRTASERWASFLEEAERRQEAGLLPFGMDRSIEPADELRTAGERPGARAGAGPGGPGSSYLPPPPGRGQARVEPATVPGKLGARSAQRPAAPAPESPPGLEAPVTRPDLGSSLGAPDPGDESTDRLLNEEEPDTVRGKAGKRLRIGVSGDRRAPGHEAFRTMGRPPAPKAPAPIEPFEEPESTQVSSRPPELDLVLQTGAQAETERGPDQTQEHVRPPEAGPPYQRESVTFELRDFGDFEEAEQTKTSLTVMEPGEEEPGGDLEGEHLRSLQENTLDVQTSDLAVFPEELHEGFGANDTEASDERAVPFPPDEEE